MKDDKGLEKIFHEKAEEYFPYFEHFSWKNLFKAAVSFHFKYLKLKRFGYIACTYLIALTGCVNYAGITSHSHLYNEASLSTHHVYAVPKKSAIVSANYWWNRFQDPQLNQLIDIALTDSPNLQVAKNRIDRAQHIAEQVGTSLWPSADLSGYARRERFTGDGLIPPPFNGLIFNIGDLGLNFQYELDFWGINRQALAARVSEMEATKADLAAARLIISTAVASSYFQLQSNVAQLKIMEDVLHQYQSILKITQHLAAHHIESYIPLSTVITQTDAAKVNVAQAKEAVMLMRYQLAALMGKNPFSTEIALNQFNYRKQFVSLPTYLPANLLAQRPDVRAACLRVEAAAHEVKVAKARFFPNINLSALYSYQSLGFNNLFKPISRDIAGEAAIDLPIFDAGLRRANLKTRYAEYDMSVNQYNDTLLTALHQVADQFTILQSVKSQLVAQTHLLQASRRHYLLTQSRYRHGIEADMPVLQSNITFLNQQHIQLQIQTQHVLAVIHMIKALGGNITNYDPN